MAFPLAFPPSSGRSNTVAVGSELHKVNKALRLVEMELPKPNPVLGGLKDHSGQSILVPRLCVHFQAVLDIRKDQSGLDINSDKFYRAALDHISKNILHKHMATCLFASSLREIINIYCQAFHRCHLNPADGGVDDDPKDAEAYSELSMENRRKLAKLMGEWMVVRANAQGNEDTAEKPAQPSADSILANVMRLGQKFGEISEVREMCEAYSTDWLENNSKLLKVKNEMQQAHYEVLNINKEKDKQREQARTNLYKMNDTIAKMNDAILELKRLLSLADKDVYRVHD